MFRASKLNAYNFYVNRNNICCICDKGRLLQCVLSNFHHTFWYINAWCCGARTVRQCLHISHKISRYFEIQRMSCVGFWSEMLKKKHLQHNWRLRAVYLSQWSFLCYNSFKWIRIISIRRTLLEAVYETVSSSDYVLSVERQLLKLLRVSTDRIGAKGRVDDLVKSIHLSLRACFCFISVAYLVHIMKDFSILQ